MAQNDNVLTDRSVIPTDDLIFSLLAERKELWQDLMNHIRENYVDAAGEWNYYNDGKRWLFKMVRKKKTLFWIKLEPNTFRVTFWFSDKAGNLINDSDLPETFSHEFGSSKKYGAIRAISVLIDNKTDILNVIKLSAIKNKVL